MNNDLDTSPKSFPFIPVLLITLSLTTLIFAGLFVVYFSQSSNVNTNLIQAKKTSAVAAKDEQKKLDMAAAERALETPFRSYDAPDQFGSFSIKFPKNWSSRVSESVQNSVQVNLSVNPDFVRYKDDVPQPVALRVRLIKQSANSFISGFEDALKKGMIKKSSISMSGQTGIAFTGHYHDESGISPDFVRLVAFPVRDKVLIFSCENGLYTAQFDTTISQSKIIP